jgi:hypothetical protein
LRVHQQEYNETYQEKILNEAEYVEHLCYKQNFMLKPEKKKTTTQEICLIQLVAGKYKKIKLIKNTKKNGASLTPMNFEHALLHPRVN